MQPKAVAILQYTFPGAEQGGVKEEFWFSELKNSKSIGNTNLVSLILYACELCGKTHGLDLHFLSAGYT